MIITLSGAKKQADQFKEKYGNYSGPGSLQEVTKPVIDFVNYLIKKYNIKRILDAPCGDWSWMQYVDLSGVDYVGYDILEKVIVENIDKYSRENVFFEMKDIINEDIPIVPDLVICRDFLFHLPDEAITQVINNICNSGAKYFISTSFDYIRTNEEFTPFSFCNNYGFRRLNLEKEPVSIYPPIEKVYETDSYQCKGRMVGLWEM